MGDAIREVEDDAEATEAWNGPLFDVWVEFRGIVAEGVAGHGEAASPPTPRARAIESSISAAGSVTRPPGWPTWSARRATLTASTLPSG